MSSNSYTTFGDHTVVSDPSSDQSSLLDNVLGAVGHAVTNTSSETLSEPERLSSSFSSPLYPGSHPPHRQGATAGPSQPAAPRSPPPVAKHRSGVAGEIEAGPPMEQPAPQPTPGSSWPVQPTAPPLEPNKHQTQPNTSTSSAPITATAADLLLQAVQQLLLQQQE